LTVGVIHLDGSGDLLGGYAQSLDEISIDAVAFAAGVDERSDLFDLVMDCGDGFNLELSASRPSNESSLVP
jgi:hypothetical protein